MNLINRLWNEIEFSLFPLRLVLLITLPAAALATEVQSSDFFAFVTALNLSGVALGVTLFRRRTSA